jgi:RNA polymerase sigma-70 factor (ECF subfamily)
MEPRTQVLEDRTASRRNRGITSSQFTVNIGAAQSLSDEALIALICKGDSEALAGLFRRYARIVRGVALRVVRDRFEAEDLLQDIFVLIHRLCQTFDSSKGSAKFWILQMSYRRAISRRRYLNSRHFYTQLELDDESFQVAEPRSGHCNDPNDSILAELDLQKLLGTLSEDQQKTLRLHFIEGYTLDEIAKMLGQTKGNVRHHSFRGLERLRKQIFGGKLPGTRAV